MFLVSVYFDEKTEKWIEKYIKDVAEKTGNRFMVDNNVPPHVTIASFETEDMDKVIKKLHGIRTELKKGQITWASVATFFPSVIYMAPVLNEYLHNLSKLVNECVGSVEGVNVGKNYQPFNWIPHTTIGKTLSKEEMQIAFKVLQNSFGLFTGEAVRIGVAKTNPYEDVTSWEFF